MLCGSKCFLVEVELGEGKKTKQVTARNSIGARKVIRGEYGAEVNILSVKERKRSL